MKSFVRILNYIRKYSLLAFLNVLFNIFFIIFSLASLSMIIPFLNLLFDKEITEETVIPLLPDFNYSTDYLIGIFNHHFIKVIVEHGKIEALIFICGLVVIIFFFKNIFRYMALFVLAPIRNGVVRDIRDQLYKKILALPISYFSEERKGDILSRMTADVQEIEHCIMSTLEVTFKEPLTIIFYLGFMFFVSPQLTVFVLVMLLVTALIVGSIGRSLKRKSTKGQAKLGDLISIIEESLTGLRIIKAFTAERSQEEKFTKENNTYLGIMTRIQRRRDLSSPLSEFLGISIIVTVLWFGGSLVLNQEGGFDAAVFIGFMVIFSQLIPPAKSFSSAFYNIQKGLASADRVNRILDAQIRIIEQPDAKPIKEFKDKIEFRNMSFAYYNFDDQKVLDSIDITIKKGRMVALVGQSGAGKTTLVDLLPRLYDPIEGEILIDGINIKNYKIGDLRKLMGVVTQESILFNDSVYNNISFGVKNATKEDIIEAAKIANAHDFITKMENGYDTLIGDRGDKMSGGEKQRLTIARAILNDPPILILDEATSSLDTHSEKLVQEAIYKLMKNRTSIVIAHRLSTIQYADEIIVMQEGKTIEKGNHIGLMAKDGVYRRLVDLQAF